MSRASRISLFVGGCIFAAVLLYSYTKEPNHYADGTVGVHFGESAFDAGLFALTAFLGVWLGLRSAPQQKITYSAGVAIALIYVALAGLVNLIPTAPITLRSDETARIAYDFIGMLALSIAAPFLI